MNDASIYTIKCSSGYTHPVYCVDNAATITKERIFDRYLFSCRLFGGHFCCFGCPETKMTGKLDYADWPKWMNTFGWWQHWKLLIRVHYNDGTFPRVVKGNGNVWYLLEIFLQQTFFVSVCLSMAGTKFCWGIQISSLIDVNITHPISESVHNVV